MVLNQILLGSGEGRETGFRTISLKIAKKTFETLSAYFKQLLDAIKLHFCCLRIRRLGFFFCQSDFDFPFSPSFFGFCAHFFAFPSNGIVAGYLSSKGEFCLEWVVGKGKQRNWPWIFSQNVSSFFVWLWKDWSEFPFGSRRQRVKGAFKMFNLKHPNSNTWCSFLCSMHKTHCGPT